MEPASKDLEAKEGWDLREGNPVAPTPQFTYKQPKLSSTTEIVTN